MQKVFTRRSLVRLAIAASVPPMMRPIAGWAQAKAPSSFVYPIAIPLYQTSYLAKELGYFADEGLDVRTLQAGSGSKTRSILAAGEAEFGVGDITHSMQLTNRGKASRILSAFDQRVSLGLVIRKDLYDQGINDIKKVAKWRRPDGRKPILGVSSLGGSSHIWADYFCSVMGINDDFTWISAGSVDTMLGLLKTKQLDVLCSTPSMIKDAESNGWGKQIYPLAIPENWNTIVGGKVPVVGTFTLQTMIDKDPKRTQAFVNATYRAAQWVKTHSPEEILGKIESYVGSTSRDANLIEIAAVKDNTDYDGTIDEASFARGAKVWFRPLTGIEPMDRKTAVADNFILAAQQRFKK